MKHAEAAPAKRAENESESVQQNTRLTNCRDAHASVSQTRLAAAFKYIDGVVDPSSKLDDAIVQLASRA